MMDRVMRQFVLLLILAIAGTGHAQLVELHDSGDSVPLEPYIVNLLAGDDDAGVLKGLRFPLVSSLQRSVLPMDGARVFEPKWLTQDIFVIGTDEHSLAWLNFNHAAMQQLGARGIVVAAANEAEFKLAQRVAKPILLAPAISPWLEQRLRRAGVDVYPVLIRRDGTAHQIVGGAAWR